MGLLPKPELLENFTSLFEEARARAERRSWPDTLTHHRFLRAAWELFAFDLFYELLHPSKFIIRRDAEMNRLIGNAILVLLIGALVFVALHAILTPFGWGMAWGRPMLRAHHAHPVLWLLASFAFTLIWLVPFVFIVALFV